MDTVNKWPERISISRGYLLLTLTVLFILFSFTGWPGEQVLMVLTGGLILYSLPFMAFFPKIMTSILLITGHLVFFAQDLGFSYWRESLIENLPLVALFVSVPLFAYPLKNGGYVEYISIIAHRFLKTPVKIFSNIVILTSILSSFMNLGSVRISFELFHSEIEKNPKFYTKAISQGFTLAMCWSPYFAGVAIVLSMLGLPIFPFIFWGLLLVLIGTAVSVLLIMKQPPETEELAAAMDKEMQAARAATITAGKGIELLVIFAGMFAGIFILERLLDVNLVILISVIAIAYPILWSVCINKVQAFGRSLQHYKNTILPNIHNEAVLFIAAAFFAKMVETTPVSPFIASFFASINQLSPLLVIVMTIGVIVLLGAGGIHQILTVSLIGASVSTADLTISVEAFALALMAGWSLSTVVSPVAALNLTLGTLLHRSPFKVGMWNLPYVLVTGAFVSVVIYGISYLTM
ncbi:hypothetical protein ATL39_0499 [Sinobaca qinghaiensis]|uniref:Uncharacterized protein n=1 Tax=Sinobaca qinghaiensis TaxID=342944 RepID=A0A419V843_9BACL|nr:hypothetical protein [Sinobaca qinghaiensis]RKD76284.1 hypothetical protein ATL39_0499 [Sinobaca qinghaiensis]